MSFYHFKLIPFIYLLVNLKSFIHIHLPNISPPKKCGSEILNVLHILNLNKGGKKKTKNPAGCFSEMISMRPLALVTKVTMEFCKEPTIGCSTPNRLMPKHLRKCLIDSGWYYYIFDIIFILSRSLYNKHVDKLFFILWTNNCFHPLKEKSI